MTYRKLAQLAGVSLSTVSKALSGSSEISSETAERILHIAVENGVVRPKYRHDHPIRRVVIIVPEIVSVYYSQLASLISEELRGCEIEPSIYICGFGDERLKQIIDMLSYEKLVDGIISLESYTLPQKAGLPMVCMGSLKSSPFCDSVGADMLTGIFEAVEYLLSLGHRKIGFISERNTSAKLTYFNSAAA